MYILKLTYNGTTVKTFNFSAKPNRVKVNKYVNKYSVSFGCHLHYNLTEVKGLTNV